MGKTFTMAEVEKHCTEDSAWIVVDGSVYDTTSYLKDHPGGAASIMLNAGADATEEFFAIHSEKARSMLDDFYIGELAADEKPHIADPMKFSKSSAQLMIEDFPKQDVRTTKTIDAAEDLVALHPKKWIGFELIDKTEVSHDTRLFKFKLQTPGHRLGLPVGYHMFIQGTMNNRW